MYKKNIPTGFFEKYSGKLNCSGLFLNEFGKKTLRIPAEFFENYSDKLNCSGLHSKKFRIIKTIDEKIIREKYSLVLEDIKLLSYVPKGINTVLPKGGYDYREVMEKYEK